MNRPRRHPGGVARPGPPPRIGRWLLAAALALVASGRAARAQDEELEPELAAPAQGVAVYTDDTFYQWIFGNANSADACRGQLDARLTLQVEEVARACGITAPQRAKLLLAGKGDVKRFFDRVAEKKKVFDRVKHDQNKIGEVFQEIQPLQMSLHAGLFGEGSIFGKALRRTLDAEQVRRYEEVLREGRAFRYRARVELVVAQYGESAGLTADQRRRLVALILDETRPPKRSGQYDYNIVQLHAARLPEARLRAIVDDRQWRLLSAQLQNAKGMEQFLKMNGYLDDEAGGPAGAEGGTVEKKAN